MNQKNIRLRIKRGLSSQSPSKYLSKKFLNNLRENNYISKSGIEYAPCEVDALYFEKCSQLKEKEINEQLKIYWNIKT